MLNEFFAKLPIRKYFDKPINFFDSDNKPVGFVQRYYKNIIDKIYNILPLPFSGIFETKNLKGAYNGIQIEIREKSLRSNLFKLKWDVYKSCENEISTYLLEDKTEIATNPRFIYHKNDKKFLFKKDIFDRTCNVCLDDIHKCAEIKIERLLPTSLKFTLITDELDQLELMGIYYILNLTY